MVPANAKPQKGVTRFPNAMWGKYQPSTSIVWIALYSHDWKRDGARPSIATIMSQTGLGRTAVKSAIRKLVAAGDVMVQTRGAAIPNRYHFPRVTKDFTEFDYGWWSLGLTPSQAMVLLAIRNFEGLKYGAVPGSRELAKMTKLGKDTVLEVVTSLENRGILQVDQRTWGKKRKSNKYAIRAFAESESRDLYVPESDPYVPESDPYVPESDPLDVPESDHEEDSIKNTDLQEDSTEEDSLTARPPSAARHRESVIMVQGLGQELPGRNRAKPLASLVSSRNKGLDAMLRKSLSLEELLAASDEEQSPKVMQTVLRAEEGSQGSLRGTVGTSPKAPSRTPECAWANEPWSVVRKRVLAERARRDTPGSVDTRSLTEQIEELFAQTPCVA